MEPLLLSSLYILRLLNIVVTECKFSRRKLVSVGACLRTQVCLAPILILPLPKWTTPEKNLKYIYVWMLNSIIHICEFNTYFHMYHVLCSVTQLFPTLCDPMDCNPQGTSLHRLSRQEYWSGLPFPTSAHFPDPGIKPRYLASPALAGRFLTTMPCGELKKYTCGFKYILTYVLRVHMYIYIY